MSTTNVSDIRRSFLQRDRKRAALQLLIEDEYDTHRDRCAAANRKFEARKASAHRQGAGVYCDGLVAIRANYDAEIEELERRRDAAIERLTATAAA